MLAKKSSQTDSNAYQTLINKTAATTYDPTGSKTPQVSSKLFLPALFDKMKQFQSIKLSVKYFAQ